MSRKATKSSSHRTTLLRWSILLLAPVAVFLVLGVQRFSLQNGVDPFIYVGYQQDTSDLLDRYGWLYFPVRFGLLWPAALATKLFGIVPGYFVLRYLLALLALGSLVWLGRSRGSRLSGWAAGLACLASPVFIAAVMTVYADTVGLPCLIAGCALLLGRGDRPVGRALLAGLLFAVAFHANFFVVLPLVGGFGLRAVLQVARGEWRRLVDYVLVGAAVLVVTLVGMVGYRLLYGTFDVLGPSIDAARTYSGDAGQSFRQNNHLWLRISPHLYIPPLVALALAALIVTRPSVEGESRWARWSREGASDTVVMLVGVLTAVGLQQFVLDGYSVETFYYYSYTFAFTCVALVMLFAELVARSGPAAAVAAAVAVILAPLARNIAFQDLEVWVLPWVPILAGCLVVGAVATRWSSRVGPGLAALVAITVGVLAFAPPVDVPRKPWMSPRVEPRFEQTLGNRSADGIRIYEASAELVDVVPKWADDPGTTIYWYDSNSPLLNAAQATAYWRTAALQELGPGLPKLEKIERRQLRKRTPRHLVILSESASDLAERVRGVEAVVTPTAEEEHVVGSDEMPVYVAVLTFEPSSCDQDWRGRSPWLELPPCP